MVGFSGDIKQAQKRAAEAKNGVEIDYAIPKDGAQLWFDNLAIPKDAKNVAEAHALINYLLQARGRGEEYEFHLSMPTAMLASRSLDRQGDPRRQHGLSRRRDDEDPLHVDGARSEDRSG